MTRVSRHRSQACPRRKQSSRHASLDAADAARLAMPVCRQQDPQLMPAGSDTLHEQACHLDEATKEREATKLVAMLTAGAPS